MRRVLRAGLLAVSLFVAACSPDPPTLTPERATITGLSTSGLELRAELSAHNPNRIDLSAKAVTAKVVLDGKIDLGTMTVKSGLVLPAKKTTRLVVPVSLKWTDLSSVALLAAQPRDVPYEVTGTVELGGESLRVSIPYRMSGTVSHDQLVQAAKQSIPKIPSIPGLPSIPGITR